MIEKLLAIAVKDLLRSVRSLFAVGMMLVLPMLITGLIFFAFGGFGSGGDSIDIADINVAVVNQDQASLRDRQLSQKFIEFLLDEEMPDWLKVKVVEDETQARLAIDRQEIEAAIIIPAGFSRALLRSGGNATLVILHDPTLTIAPAILQELVGQFVDAVSGTLIGVNVMVDQLEAEEVAIDEAALWSAIQRYTAWFSSLQEGLRESNQPALRVRPPAAETQAGAANGKGALMGQVMAGMMIFFVFFSGAASTESILVEHEEGTLARLFVTPTPRRLILGGKFLAVVLTVAIQSLVLMAASALAFGVWWGRPASVFLAWLGMAVASTGFGIFLMSMLKSSRQSGVVLGGVVSATGMMGGLMTTGMMNLPAAFNIMNLFVPQGWALLAW